MKVVIIDDEKHFLDSLAQMVSHHFNDLEVVGTALTVEEGLECIRSTDPDLVFLDVEIGQRTGFELLELLDERTFSLIFITAYNHYAVNAFRFSAIDFLLKPLILENLQEAIARARNNYRRNHLEEQLKVLTQSLGNIPDQERKIVLKGLESFHVVKTFDILWCSAEGSYTSFHLADGSTVVVSKHLKEYEKMLSSSRFFRVHRSFLINLDQITRYDRSEGVLIFKGNYPLPVSLKRDRMDELIEKL